MSRSGDRARLAPALAGIGLLVAVAVGSWWTALAVVDGSTVGVLVRFAASLAAGFYYLVMLRVATGRPLARR
ncbi:MAG: hypothetical protein ACR2QK_13300 [Acidimicrobiales bacterium]